MCIDASWEYILLLDVVSSSLLRVNLHCVLLSIRPLTIFCFLLLLRRKWIGLNITFAPCGARNADSLRAWKQFVRGLSVLCWRQCDEVTNFWGLYRWCCQKCSYILYILILIVVTYQMNAFSALTLLIGCQEGHLACKNWVVRYWCCCLSEWGANDLHMVQLMPLPPQRLLL